MRELQVLDAELKKCKTVVLRRKDIGLFEKSLATEAIATLRDAERDAKRLRLGNVTLLVILHDAPAFSASR